MPDHDEQAFQVSLKHLEMLYNAALHSDQFTAQIGMLALKMVLTINGAALVAILAAYPSLLGLEDNASTLVAVIPGVGKIFVVGLAAGVAATIVAYFRQYAMTGHHSNLIHKEFPENDKISPPHPCAHKFVEYMTSPMIMLALASFGLFCWGSWTLLGGFTVP